MYKWEMNVPFEMSEKSVPKEGNKKKSVEWLVVTCEERMNASECRVGDVGDSSRMNG